MGDRNKRHAIWIIKVHNGKREVVKQESARAMQTRGPALRRLGYGFEGTVHFG
jgi:hypothetical protein